LAPNKRKSNFRKIGTVDVSKMPNIIIERQKFEDEALTPLVDNDQIHFNIETRGHDNSDNNLSRQMSQPDYIKEIKIMKE
jgi:hypothetical protein